MPLPANVHPAIATHAGSPKAGVAPTSAIAAVNCATPTTPIRRLPSRSPYRPDRSAAAAHARAAVVRPRPAKVGEKSKSAISRYGT